MSFTTQLALHVTVSKLNFIKINQHLCLGFHITRVQFSDSTLSRTFSLWSFCQTLLLFKPIHLHAFQNHLTVFKITNKEHHGHYKPQSSISLNLFLLSFPESLFKYLSQQAGLGCTRIIIIFIFTSSSSVECPQSSGWLFWSPWSKE